MNQQNPTRSLGSWEKVKGHNILSLQLVEIKKHLLTEVSCEEKLRWNAFVFVFFPFVDDTHNIVSHDLYWVQL